MFGLNKLNLNKIDSNHRLRIKAMEMFSFLPDKTYLKFVYRMRTGKKLELNTPSTFSEKLNWLKLNDRQFEYTELVDKIAVRDVVKAKIGDGHSFPILGCWDSFDEIDFTILPNSFVLKCNHDSGSCRIIKDKSTLTLNDFSELKNHFIKKMASIPFTHGREYPYKNIQTKIFAEKYMGNDTGIKDYKFLCFNGKPRIMYIAGGRNGNPYNDFYDMDFNHLDITAVYPQSKEPIEKPECFEEMKVLAEKLTEGMRFVRLDLYEVDGRVYFGEYTFFPWGGFYPLKPDKWENLLGSWINLPQTD